jgi:hypothetical protein
LRNAGGHREQRKVNRRGLRIGRRPELAADPSSRVMGGTTAWRARA